MLQSGKISHTVSTHFARNKIESEMDLIKKNLIFWHFIGLWTPFSAIDKLEVESEIQIQICHPNLSES